MYQTTNSAFLTKSLSQYSSNYTFVSVNDYFGIKNIESNYFDIGHITKTLIDTHKVDLSDVLSDNTKEIQFEFINTCNHAFDDVSIKNKYKLFLPIDSNNDIYMFPIVHDGTKMITLYEMLLNEFDKKIPEHISDTYLCDIPIIPIESKDTFYKNIIDNVIDNLINLVEIAYKKPCLTEFGYRLKSESSDKKIYVNIFDNTVIETSTHSIQKHDIDNNPVPITRQEIMAIAYTYPKHYCSET